MLRYVVRRLLLLIPILFGVSLLVFFWIRLLPGSPAEALLGALSAAQRTPAGQAGTAAAQGMPVAGPILNALLLADKLPGPLSPHAALEASARAVLKAADRSESDIDWLIPHQANIRIMQGTARKLKLPMDKLVSTVQTHGNTSAASIPLALDVACRDGRVKTGDTVMLEGVGGGFTWGAVLLDF